jgi:hypothetical protein
MVYLFRVVEMPLMDIIVGVRRHAGHVHRPSCRPQEHGVSYFFSAALLVGMHLCITEQQRHLEAQGDCCVAASMRLLLEMLQ